MRKDEADRVLEILRAAPVFRRLPARRLRQLVIASRLERFAAGQMILRQGTMGDAFYVVIEGQVTVRTRYAPGESADVAALGPGQYFGELALLNARARTADVLADTDTAVLVVPPAAFEGQLLSDAWFRARLVEQSHERESDLLRQRVARRLQSVPLFSALRWDELLSIAASGQVSRVAAGTIVCRQGDPATAVYVLMEGELAVLVDSGNGARLIATLCVGASFGEVALLRDERVAATVEAAQESTLLVLEKAQFRALLDRAPIARSVSHTLGGLERQGEAGAPAPGPRGTIVAVSGPAAGADAATLAVNLAASLAQQVGAVALVDLSSTGIAVRYAGADPSHWDPTNLSDDRQLPQTESRLAPFAAGVVGYRAAELDDALAVLSRRYPYVVVVGDDASDPTARQLLGPTDALVLIARDAATLPSHPAAPGAPEVLLVRSPGSATPLQAPDLADQVFELPSSLLDLQRFQPTGRLFVLEEPRSFLSRAVGRISRYLTRQQVGLVLSGAAAWAPSQAGVLAGLEERAVDVDLLVGSGIGGLLGAAYAVGLPVQSLERLGVAFQTPLEDLLAPRTPRRADVARGRRLRHLLRSLFGSMPLESLQLPLWIVAADADTGEEVVLRSGSLADALEASLGLRDEADNRRRRGRRLFDSSVVNPVPVGLAREMGADVVVALAASPRPGVTGLGPRGRRALGRRRAPLQLAMQALRLAAHRLGTVSAEAADVVIAPAGGVESGRLLFAQGRRAANLAAPRIAALQAARLRQPLRG